MKIVDLRSDTVSRPTGAMRGAMAAAEVGDDVFGDDPSVLRLEARIAALLGKEAAIFVPSGTMANQLALKLQTRPGDAVLCHARCHVLWHEAGAAPVLSGVQLLGTDSDDGTLDLDVLRARLRPAEDGANPPTPLVMLENTHNQCGGRVVPQSHVRAVADVAAAAGAALHLDGARLWNAHIQTGASLAELAAPATTVSICLSKGIGAPVGSLLCLPRALWLPARRLRRMLGGSMRQAGVLAAAGLHALDHHVERLSEDHRRAKALADALAAVPGVDLVAPETNIVRFRLAAEHPLAADGPTGLQARALAAGVALTGAGGAFRAVLHLDIDDAALARACDRLANLIAHPDRA